MEPQPPSPSPQLEKGKAEQGLTQDGGQCACHWREEDKILLNTALASTRPGDPAHPLPGCARGTEEPPRNKFPLWRTAMPPAIPAQQTAGQALEAPWPSRSQPSPSLAWLFLATTCTGAPVRIGLSGRGRGRSSPCTMRCCAPYAPACALCAAHPRCRTTRSMHGGTMASPPCSEQNTDMPLPAL